MSWDTDLAKLAKNVEAPARADETQELAWVRENAATHDFARSLKSYFDRNGSLTPAQVAAVTRILERTRTLQDFHHQYAPEIAWIRKNMLHNDFAASLWAGLERFGALTDRQIEAVRRNMKAEIPASEGLDLSPLPAGRYAVPNGDTRLKIMIQKPTHGSRTGWIFVTDAAVYGARTRYGLQAPGKAYAGKIEEQLAAILRDPMAALKAYGHLTGTCGVCGRPLEDAESVARGIGPVCAGRF